MKFQFKGFLSLFLALIFLALSISGVVLYLTPRGRVANWTGWTMLGLGKQSWQAVHINVALLFLIVTILHLYLNWPVFWRYLKKQGSLALNLRLEILLALLLAAAILAGAIARIFPFDALVDVNYQIKDYWERSASEGPTPHAEELRLDQFAADLGLAASEVMEALRQSDIRVNDAGATIGEIAEANHRTPADVYSAIQKRFPDAEQRGNRGGRGPGIGPGRGGGGRGRGPDF